MKTFRVYNKDELTAEGEIKGNRVYIKRYTMQPGIQQFYADEMDLFHLGEIFEMRLIPRNRASIDEILKSMGLDHYDVFKMIQITHGLMWNDYIWFEFDDEHLTYEDIKIRD